jgi:hypothetical protein
VRADKARSVPELLDRQGNGEGAAASLRPAGCGGRRHAYILPGKGGATGANTMAKQPTPPEQPRAEPEIIPPDRAGARAPWRGEPAWTATDGVHRVYVTRIGPFGFVLLVLVVAILVAVAFLILLGAFLVVIPLAGLLLVAAVIAGLMRGFFRPR